MTCKERNIGQLGIEIPDSKILIKDVQSYKIVLLLENENFRDENVDLQLKKMFLNMESVYDKEQEKTF